MVKDTLTTMHGSQFNVSLLSKYRTELMGVGAILIILCHSVVEGCLLPRPISYILGLGNVGVDMFLFLSGLGLYFSLHRKGSVLNTLGSIRPKNNVNKWGGVIYWYSVRYKRVLVPYLVITIPWWIYYSITRDIGLYGLLINLSTLGYWVSHYGAWFVALLIPLYFITPIFAITFDKIRQKIIALLLLSCLIFIITDNITVSSDNAVLNAVLINLQLAFRRTPIFFIGYYSAIAVIKNWRCNYLWILLFPILQLIMSYIPIIDEWGRSWLLTFPLMMICCWIFENKWAKAFCGISIWMGGISLESYLANVFVSYALKEIPELTCGRGIFFGNYIYYSLVVTLGLLIAVLANKIVSLIINK